MSSIITHKGSLLYKDHLQVPSYTIYGVSLDEFKDEFDANTYAKSVQKKGGMGQVYQSGEYYVLAQAYPTLSQALEVQDNLINLDYNSKVVAINVPAIDLVYKGDNKTNAKLTFLQFKNIYNSLFSLCISFDAGNITRVNFNGKLAYILSQNMEHIKCIPTLGLEENQEKQLTLSLKNVNAYLEQVLYDSSSDTLVSSLIKRQMLCVVQENILLAQKIS